MTRRNEYDAYKGLSEARRRVQKPVIPPRDYRPLWIALVGVLTAVALWGTFQ